MDRKSSSIVKLNHPNEHNKQAQHLGDDNDEEVSYVQQDRKYDRCPSHVAKIVIGDLNAQMARKRSYGSLSKSINRFTNECFAASKNKVAIGIFLLVVFIWIFF